jgi:hypothetical protein
MKTRLLEQALIHHDWCPYKEKSLGHKHIEGKILHVSHREKMATSKPRERRHQSCHLGLLAPRTTRQEICFFVVVVVWDFFGFWQYRV